VKRKIGLVGLAVILLIGIGIVSGWAIAGGNDSSDPELSLPDAIQIDFGTRYGLDKPLLSLTEAEDMYILIWEDAENRYATMWLDGLWVELMNTPLNEGTVTE